MYRLTIAALLMLSATPVSAGESLAGEAAAGSPDKIVCKRFVETGSLVKSHKECKTRRDWQRERDVARETGEAFDPHITTEHGT